MLEMWHVLETHQLLKEITIETNPKTIKLNWFDSWASSNVLHLFDINKF